MKTQFKIGTRGSKLALYQAELVKANILKDYPAFQIEIVIIKTKGDMIRRGGLSSDETKSVFTREIEDALIAGEVDIAVHSAKDMAAVLPEGTQIAAVLQREDPRDCLVSRDSLKLAELPLGARIGTSSLRRKKQLSRWIPELVIEDVRGNVDSRIRKTTEGHFDGLILAYAGIKRLGMAHVVTEVFEEDVFCPAPGQGTIVTQTRKGDAESLEVLHVMNHRPSQIRLEAERAFLKTLQGGCQLPCGMTTTLESEKIKVRGILFDLTTSECVEAECEGSAEAPEVVGVELAQLILSKGGREILEKIRKV